MAEAQAPTASPSSLAGQEARRLELLRARRPSETGEPVQYGPTPFELDAGVRQVPIVGRVAQNLHERGIARIGGQPSRFVEAGAGAAAVDQAIGRQGREESFASRLRRGRPQAQAQQEEGGSLGLLGQGAGALAGSSPVGGAIAALASGDGGNIIGKTKQQIGTALIKTSWSWLWPSFGHTVYILDILFFAAWGSKYLREYIPEIGQEWIPPEVLSKMPKTALLPLKLGEICALFMITFLVFFLDLLMIANLAVLFALLSKL